MEIYITRTHKEEPVNYPDDLPKCPICGSKPFVSKDVVDGFYFGWSVGCPRYRLNDGIHGHGFDTPESKRLTIFGLNSKEECYRAWNERLKEYETIQHS